MVITISEMSRLFVPAGVTAGTAAAAPATLFAADCAAHGKREQRDERQDNQNIPNIHPNISTAIPIRRTMYAATHASAHCHSASPTAHFAPSSRRTDAIAAMQGV